MAVAASIEKGGIMTDSKTGRATGGNIVQLQGTINIAAQWGYLSIQTIDLGTAVVEWSQGDAPLKDAQFEQANMPRIPMPRPIPPVPLQPGPNTISVSGRYTNGISWDCSGAAASATFQMNLPGVPVGPDGWALKADISSPQQGTFQILGMPEPSTRVVSFSIMSYGTTVTPTVMMYVDGAFLATCVDGMEVVSNGKIVSLAIDARGLPPTGQVSVGYIINPEQTASVARRQGPPSRPSAG